MAPLDDAALGHTFDPQGRVVEHEAVNQAVVWLYRMFPDVVFSAIGPPQTFHDIGRQAWDFGEADKASQVTGLDTVTVRDGRIAALYAFVDPPTVTQG